MKRTRSSDPKRAQVPDHPSAGTARCNLVLGECVQGKLRGGPHFLITSPIELFSRARFVPDGHLGGVVVSPPECTKAKTAVERYLRDRGLPVAGRLEIDKPVCPALGFGTSTADISAGILAAASAWKRVVSPEEISRIAVEIEPTDGSMYPGCVAYAHREGRLLETFGPLPPFKALVALGSNGVDTVAFDELRRSFEYTLAEEQELRRAWSIVREAVRMQRVDLLGQAGIISGHVNQRLLPSPLFMELDGTVKHLGVEGLFIAHSGSLVALILDPAKPGYHHVLERAMRHLESLGTRDWLEVSASRPLAPISRARGSGSRRIRLD